MSGEEPGSRAAGACVLVVLTGAAGAVVFVASPTAGVLSLWVTGTAVLYRAVRRRVSDSSAPPPPRGVAPAEREFPGQRDARGIRRVEREGMLIFYDDSEQRHHTLP